MYEGFLSSMLGKKKEESVPKPSGPSNFEATDGRIRLDQEVTEEQYLNYKQMLDSLAHLSDRELEEHGADLARMQEAVKRYELLHATNDTAH